MELIARPRKTYITRRWTEATLKSSSVRASISVRISASSIRRLIAFRLPSTSRKLFFTVKLKYIL